MVQSKIASKYNASTFKAMMFSVSDHLFQGFSCFDDQLNYNCRMERQWFDFICTLNEYIHTKIKPIFYTLNGTL